jgi:hypothetical protein
MDNELSRLKENNSFLLKKQKNELISQFKEEQTKVQNKL